MICPHCKKAIRTEVSETVIKRAKELRRQGYSLRDIEMLLRDEGMTASFTTISRRLKIGRRS